MLLALDFIPRIQPTLLYLGGSLERQKTDLISPRCLNRADYLPDMVPPQTHSRLPRGEQSSETKI
jgi:hypothetical protein